MHPDRPFESNGATVPAGGTAAKKQRDGLSLQTLVIAAVASGIAAVLTSHVWKSGTAVAAAMTPVIVALVKEALQRPLESERVRRPVSRVSEIATARRAVAGVAAARTEAAQRQSAGYGSNVPPPPPPPAGQNGDQGLETAGDELLSPRRNYVSGSGGITQRRRLHVKLAIVTGLLAFVIAALVLTLPELLFGGAVSSNHRTTIFGGGTSSSQSDKKKSDTNGSSDNQSKQQDKNTQTTPSQQQQQPTQTQPQQTTPSQPQQQQPQPAPSGSAPAPSSPAPSSPSPPAP